MTRRALAAAAMCVTVLVSCACARPAEEPAAPVKSSATTRPAEESTTATPLAARQAEMFKRWASTQQRFTDRAKAQAELPFTLKMPDPSLVPSPAVFYVQPGGRRPKTPARATVVFGEESFDTICLIANRSKVRQDPRTRVRQDEEARRGGAVGSDHAWELVTVNGIEAVGIEPGINAGARADHRLRPGVVYWWDGGVHYVLSGTQGPGGTPLAELVEIAESMR